MICPCKGCEKKGCGSLHDSCEAYQAWLIWNNERKKKRHEYHDVRQLSRDHELKYRKNLKKGVYK